MPEPGKKDITLRNVSKKSWRTLRFLKLRLEIQSGRPSTLASAFEEVIEEAVKSLPDGERLLLQRALGQEG